MIAGTLNLAKERIPKMPFLSLPYNLVDQNVELSEDLNSGPVPSCYRLGLPTQLHFLIKKA